MNQLALRLVEKSSADTQRQLIQLLADGKWHHRDCLARQLGVHVRTVRDAVHHAAGEVISSNDGLKLTVCATQEEIDEAIGRARSQVSEMTKRIVATLHVWEAREAKRA